MMFARLTRIEGGTPHRMDEGIRHFREETLPAAEAEQGFQGGMLLVDRVNNAGMAVMLWDSEDDLSASESFHHHHRRKAAEKVDSQGDHRVEHYEVVVPLQSV